jgi:hypothetical protein
MLIKQIFDIFHIYRELGTASERVFNKGCDTAGNQYYHESNDRVKNGLLAGRNLFRVPRSRHYLKTADKHHDGAEWDRDRKEKVNNAVYRATEVITARSKGIWEADGGISSAIGEGDARTKHQ